MDGGKDENLAITFQAPLSKWTVQRFSGMQQVQALIVILLSTYI